MKKLLFFIGLLSVSLLSFGQYTEDKLPSGLTVTTSLAANDYQIVQKTGESYVKAIKAYHAYLYYKKMLDSIVNLTVSNNLTVGNDVNITGSFAVGGLSNFSQSANFYGTIGANNDVYFTDSIYIYEIGYLDNYGYAMVLDTSDNIVKLAPMPDGVPDFNNVAYVNYDLTGDLESQLIFDSYASAAVWIDANGSPTSDNHWTIVMPSGYCDEEIVVDEFIDIQGHVGTVINSVSSKVVGTGANIFDVTIKNCIVDTLWVDEGKIFTFKDCIINWVEPVNGAGTGYVHMDNCMVLGGDFTNTNQILMWDKITMIAFDDFIALDSLDIGLKGSKIYAASILPGTMTTLPMILENCDLSISRNIEQSKISLFSCGGDIDTLTITTNELEVSNSNIGVNEFNFVGCNIINSNIYCDTVNITDGKNYIHNSKIEGVKNVSGDSEVYLYQSTLNVGGVNLEDTAECNIYDGSRIEGGIVQVDPTTTINDYRSAYAEIYYADASTAQSIPTGTTYTKWTAFTNDGEENNCTADAANDKITITEAGVYAVQGNFSSSCGTNAVVLRTALFVGGVEVSKIQKIATFSTQNNSQSGSISGLIYVAPADVPVDIDIRLRHDNGGSVDFTGIYGNLTVYKISEY